MLKELGICNFAIIDEMKVSFEEGLNIISGETGAGKSIVIGAISLLLGERASADVIRSSEDSAIVEAIFDVADQKDLQVRLNAMGFHPGRELVIKRIVSRSGKNRVYIDGSLATLNMLSTVTESLINICGQHEHQMLLNTENHIDILDEFGGLLPERASFASLYEDYQLLKRNLDTLQNLHRQRNEREDLLRFQLKEIEDAGIKPDEDVLLAEERKILSNARKLIEYAEASHETLYGREGALLSELGRVIQQIREIKRIDQGLAVSMDDLDSIRIQLEDTAAVLRQYMKNIPDDPERLGVIEDRIELLGRLKKKYGGTLTGVLKTGESVRGELERMSSLSDEIDRISREISEKKAYLMGKAQNLSQGRRKKAAMLETAVEREIQDLKMTDARFRVVFQEPFREENGEFLLHSKGLDHVEFFLSTNVGEEMKALSRIASGGELSRIMLAMKKVLARTGSVGTVIFDEVDSGIGGATAEVVGRKLRDVADHHQVICITHLPQIACFGNSHYRVSKEVSGERTRASIRGLPDSERLEEITRMLGGVEITQKTKDHAREMLKKCRQGGEQP